jgi:hypothetical protein
LAEKVAGNERDDGGNEGLCALAFDGGNGWQQQRLQWRMKAAFNDGGIRQLQHGGETTVQWTTTAAVAATMVAAAMMTTTAAAAMAMMTMMAMAVATKTAAGTDNNHLWQ